MSTPRSVPAPTLDACRTLTVGEVGELLRLSHRSVWRLAALAAAGRESFPTPITIGPRLRRWRARDVAAYLDALQDKGRP
ncbi:MAG: hypothetical protein FJ290_10255 [Planctomycetes bacterium]|nr:hypothetical protein [Planctomycetota bacterium]